MKKTLMTVALLAAICGAQAATSPPAPIATVQAADKPAVTVTGATTLPGAPLLLALHGGKPSEPDFQALYATAQSNPSWDVVHVTNGAQTTRVTLKSSGGHAELSMDVATNLVNGLKIAKGTKIGVETQSSGQGALIKFMKDKTPLGFMVNQNTAVPGQ